LYSRITAQHRIRNAWPPLGHHRSPESLLRVCRRRKHTPGRPLPGPAQGPLHANCQCHRHSPVLVLLTKTASETSIGSPCHRSCNHLLAIGAALWSSSDLRAAHVRSSKKIGVNCSRQAGLDSLAVNLPPISPVSCHASKSLVVDSARWNVSRRPAIKLGICQRFS
jgi:hypothetical protein